MKYRQVLLGMLLVLAAPLWASGYGLSEQGVQGQGSAGAFVARAEDGSALYYNPAGLSRLRFTEIALSAMPAFSKSFYSNPGQSTWESDAKIDTLSNLFVNFNLGRVGLGIGSATTHQLELEWDESDFPGRFLSIGSEFRVQEHMAGIGIRLSRSLSIGATFRLAQADMLERRILARPLDLDNGLFYETRESFDADGDGTGFTLGLQYARGRRFQIGVSYQSEIELDLDGRRSFSLYNRLDDPRANAAFDQNFSGATLTTALTLPERIALGFSSKVTVRTRVEADITLDQWSSVETLVIATRDSLGQPEEVVLPRAWDDSLTIRLSGDFQQRRAILWRIGLGNVRNVVPQSSLSPSFPDNDRFMYSFGVSYAMNRRLILEAAWLYTQNRDRNTLDQERVLSTMGPDFVSAIEQPGLYETQRTRFNLGVRLRFGNKAP